MTHLNALLNDKDEEIAKDQRKLESHEFKMCQHQQQMKELQHKYDDIRKTHKLEIANINNTLISKTEEVFQLKNHNKTLVTNIKKLKRIRKSKQVNEDFEGKIIEKQEENHRLRNINQQLEEQIKELKRNKKSQVERFKKIQSNNTLLENKLEQIQKEASRFSSKQIQVKYQETTPIKKQQKLLINTQTIKIILTNDRVKMNINGGVMISEEKKNKMNKLNKK